MKTQIIEIPEDLWQKMMIVKANTNKSLKDQIQEALKKHLKNT